MKLKKEFSDFYKEIRISSEADNLREKREILEDENVESMAIQVLIFQVLPTLTLVIMLSTKTTDLVFIVE